MKLQYVVFLLSSLTIAYPNNNYSHTETIPVVEIPAVYVTQTIDPCYIERELQGATDRVYYLEQELNKVISEYNRVVSDFNSIANFPKDYEYLTYLYNDLFNVAKSLEQELDCAKERLRDQAVKTNLHKRNEEYWKSEYYNIEEDRRRLKKDSMQKESMLQKRIDARNEVLDGRGLSYQVEQYERRAESAEANSIEAINQAKREVERTLARAEAEIKKAHQEADRKVQQAEDKLHATWWQGFAVGGGAVALAAVCIGMLSQ